MKTHDEVMAAFEREILRTGKSRNTRKTYAPTVSEFTHMMIRREITGPQGYFDYLSTVKKLPPNGVNYALNPLKFLYEQVIKKEFGQYDLPQRNYSKPMRSVLTMREILSMMAIMDRIPSLQAGMIAGSGLRVESDMLTLRLKDIRIPDRVITIYEAKGNKSRAVKIPEFLVDPLEKQIAACRRQWDKDRAKGIICPHPQESLMRKLSRNTFGTLPWYWLFPSRITHGDERWYSSSKQLVSGLREAAGQLGIAQRVNPHALRHSYATGLLRDGVDVRVIQENMGHTSLATTEIYLHTAGLKTAPSPLDTEIARNLIAFPRSA